MDLLKRNKAAIAVLLTIILMLVTVITIEHVEKVDVSEQVITKELVRVKATQEPSVEPTASAMPLVTSVPAKKTAAPETAEIAETDNSEQYYLGTEETISDALQTAPETAKSDNDSQQCTISIYCTALLANMDRLDRAKHRLIPDDGCILPPVMVDINDGENVFDVLRRATKENKIHMEFVKTPVYNSAYIEGINNLYEFDCGELSGWMYSVNGEFPNYGCSSCKVKDGDVIVWYYTCDLGRDVSGRVVSQREEIE